MGEDDDADGDERNKGTDKCTAMLTTQSAALGLLSLEFHATNKLVYMSFRYCIP